MSHESPTSLNAYLNLWGDGKTIQFDKDKEATRQFFVGHGGINENTVFFHTLREKLDYLFENGYYDKAVFDQYTWDFVKEAYQSAYAFRHRFKSYMGALKFYRQYALKTNDGERYLERYEDRVVACALTLARGDAHLALDIISAIIKGEYQPATPTFMNTGRANSGEMISCFLQETTDNLESINATLSSALQLSKRGGGVAINLNNIRSAGDPIKNVAGVSSGVIPFAKLIEDGFSYINQLGQRQGAAAVYISAHHLDILPLLDSKRENADEKIRLKTLSVGVTVPDITYELARKGEDMYMFSPYDVERVYGKPFSYIDITSEYRSLVENPDIRKKKTSARKFFQTLAELKTESGYPYIINIDHVNRANNLEGKVVMSNLCSEILQPHEPSTYSTKTGEITHVGKDVSCNLGSMNVVRAMESGDLGHVVETAIRSLTAVSQMTDISIVPPIARANRESRSVGLGQMSLASFFGKEKMIYGDEDSLDFTSAYFSAVAYHAYLSSATIAREIGAFDGFNESKYADGSALDKYLSTDYRPSRPRVQAIFDKYGIVVPSPTDWAGLRSTVMVNGLAHSHLQAVPPTGSISYIANASASLTPVPSLIEIRKEGKIGRVYYPAPELTDENREYFKTAYEVGPEAIIDVYAKATEHIDQGLSMNLFYKTNSAKDIVKSMLYAHKQGIKSIYYTRVQTQAVSGTEMDECVSCTL